MQQLINKLDRINFTAYQDDKLTSADGWEVSYHIRLQEIITESAFQVVVRVGYKGSMVMHYGCITQEETNLFGVWFLRAKYKAQGLRYAEENQNAEIGKAIFNKL